MKVMREEEAEKLLETRSDGVRSAREIHTYRRVLINGQEKQIKDGSVRSIMAAAEAHKSAGLAAVTGKHYEGGHWLGSFAVYLVAKRGISGLVAASC